MHTHTNTYTQLHLHCVLFVCVLLSTQRCFCCASLFFVVVISGQRAQTFQQQHLNFVAHTHIAFASPLDAAQSRSTLASAALLFPLSKVTEAQPKTCTQFHTHTNTLRRFVYVSWEWEKRALQSSGKGSFVRYGNCALAPILHLRFCCYYYCCWSSKHSERMVKRRGEKLQNAASSNGETTTLFQAVSTESLMFSLITSRCEIITKSVRWLQM